MTAIELIEILKKHKPDTRVLIPAVCEYSATSATCVLPNRYLDSKLPEFGQEYEQCGCGEHEECICEGASTMLLIGCEKDR